MICLLSSTSMIIIFRVPTSVVGSLLSYFDSAKSTGRSAYVLLLYRCLSKRAAATHGTSKISGFFALLFVAPFPPHLAIHQTYLHLILSRDATLPPTVGRRFVFYFLFSRCCCWRLPLVGTNYY